MGLLRFFLIGSVRLISGFFRSMNLRACRFHPSCSEYATQALRRFSLPHALALSGKRLLCCHPFSAGGFDPVPGEEI